MHISGSIWAVKAKAAALVYSRLPRPLPTAARLPRYTVVAGCATFGDVVAGVLNAVVSVTLGKGMLCDSPPRRKEDVTLEGLWNGRCGAN